MKKWISIFLVLLFCLGVANAATKKVSPPPPLTKTTSKTPKANPNHPIYPRFIKLGGFEQWYQNTSSGDFPLNHQGYFRRARAYFYGDWGQHWSFKLEYDFARPANFKNVWLKYHNDWFLARIGQFKPLWNSNYYQSPKYDWFNELPLPVLAFKPGYSRGVAVQILRKHWNIAGSFFIPGTEKQVAVRGPIGTTQWIHYVPWHKSGNVLQIALNNWYQKAQRNHNINYRSIPEARGYLALQSVQTGLINNINEYDTIDLDVIYEYNRFATKAGFIDNITPRSNASTLNFYGWYGEFSVFLTKDTLKYNYNSGALTSPVNMKFAVQALFRLSGLNLNDANIRGGKEIDATTGLDFYFLNHFKFGVDYIYAHVKESNTRINGSDHIVLAKFQLMF